ncbi:hypothetical protein OIU79_017053 [Salix purpurea]|uniref:Uncharacterized protein n=1 Tax=Salix purpurea TaxID=77065 RepID=A0A9Q0WU11_SALPP|nr:hypothetical protein OIU79_017053 [Salix purpurea]
MYRHHPATSTTISTYEEPKMISGALWRMSLGLRLPTITYKHHHTSSISSESGAAGGEKDGVYIVYMGAATEHGSSKNEHAQLLSSVLKR